jgi:hypothetical protein
MEAPVFTALNTLRASRFTVMLAKMFGQKRVAHDSGCTVTMYRWRGKWYLTDCKDEVPNAPVQRRSQSVRCDGLLGDGGNYTEGL